MAIQTTTGPFFQPSDWSWLIWYHPTRHVDAATGITLAMAWPRLRAWLSNPQSLWITCR